MSLRFMRQRALAAAATALVLLGAFPAGAGWAAPASKQSSQMVRVVVAGAQTPDAQRQVLAALQTAGAKVEKQLNLIEGYSASVPVSALTKLASAQGVAALTMDKRHNLPRLPQAPSELAAKATAEPGDGTDPNHPELAPLSLTLTGATDAWDMGIDGSGVRVAIIDSGVDFSHPDLAGTAALDSSGEALSIDFTSTDLNDTIGHATAVAGMIASQGTQVYQVAPQGMPPVYARIKGMAPKAKLLSAKIFDTRVPYQGGWDSWIIAALDWAVANRAQLVNMSLGGGAVPEDGRDPLAVAVTRARQSGVLVLTAAGNEGGGDGSIATPATAQGALAIGASTMYRSFGEMGYLTVPGKYTADQLAGFSSIGPSSDGRIKPQVLAPGAFDWSLAPMAGSGEGRIFQLFGGTSQATPVSTGAMALVYQAYRKAHYWFPSPDTAEHLLTGTADDLGYPAYLQGNGRINARRAVEAALGKGNVVAQVSYVGPRVLDAGSSYRGNFAILNHGGEAADVEVSARTIDLSRQDVVSATADAGHTVVDIPVNVPDGTDLLDAGVAWQSTDSGPASARLLLALYDPQGNFVNYQRPNVRGDMEFGHMVTARAARPAAGTWTMRVMLRYGDASSSLPFTLTVRYGKKVDWSWLSIATPSVALQGRASGNIIYVASVPWGAQAGTYLGEIDITSAGHTTTVPVSLVVPVAIRAGQGSFSGNLSHGYQGSFNNGDWRYYSFSVPGGSKNAMVTLNWPDANNAVELYLVDPNGDVANAKANDMDLLQRGSSAVNAEQITVANPRSGRWQVVVHSFGFYGGSRPETFQGNITLGQTLVTPTQLELDMAPGDTRSVSLHVSNPGVATMPRVFAYAQGTGLAAYSTPVSGTISGVPDARGNVLGQVLMGPLFVPPGASVAMAFLSWDNPNVNLAAELVDPTGTSKNSAAGRDGMVMVSHRSPWSGPWSVVVTYANPSTAGQTANIAGDLLVVAPPPISFIGSPSPIDLAAGSNGSLQVIVTAPASAGTYAGNLLVLTADGDVLASLPLTVRVTGTSQVQGR